MRQRASFHATRLAGLELFEAAPLYTAQSGEGAYCVQEVGGGAD